MVWDLLLYIAAKRYFNPMASGQIRFFGLLSTLRQAAVAATPTLIIRESRIIKCIVLMTCVDTELQVSKLRVQITPGVTPSKFDLPVLICVKNDAKEKEKIGFCVVKIALL